VYGILKLNYYIKTIYAAPNAPFAEEAVNRIEMLPRIF